MSRIIYNNRSGCYTLCKKNLGNSSADKWYQFVQIYDSNEVNIIDISNISSISDKRSFMYTRPFKLGEKVSLIVGGEQIGNAITSCEVGNLIFRNNTLQINFFGANVNYVNWKIGHLYQVDDDDGTSCPYNRTYDANNKKCQIGGQIIEVKNKDDDQIRKRLTYTPKVCDDTDSDDSDTQFKNPLKSKLSKRLFKK